LFILILGLLWIQEMIIAGYILSFILAFCGIFAFFFHFYHIRKGRPEFTNTTSKLILISTFILSISQTVLTIIQF